MTLMNTAVATSDIALAPAQETPKQTVRRVADAPERVANDISFFHAADIDEAFESHRPMRGILLGVVLGALCWAGIIALIMAL
jgi:hypothetical protein